jgi:hypothetical protein
MNKLPALNGWEKTAHSLHRATQILGALRMLALEQVPNYLELATVIQPEGLSTGRLPFGEVRANFKEAALVYQPTSADPVRIPMAGQSQASLLEKLLETMESQGQNLLPDRAKSQSRGEAFLEVLATRQHPFMPAKADLLDETPLETDPALSAEYSQALYTVFTATARFRARLNGPMTPIVVWPEHFDLSFLWFATAQASEKFPHMNFGFAPFSDGLPRPYLYAYAWPMPDGFAQMALPALAQWNTEGWQGVVVPYDELVKLNDPEKAIEQIFMAIFDTLAPTLANLTVRSA